MKKILEKWREIRDQDTIEHLTIPRVPLFVFGVLILSLQTVIIFFSFGFLLQIAGILLAAIIILPWQYYKIWKRYYSLVWPILIQILAIIGAIYVKVRFL